MRARVPRAASLLLGAVLSSCDAPVAPGGDTETMAAITDGVISERDHAVVALLDDGGQVVCTGTVIAPRVVLTAAHCAATIPTAVVIGVDPGAPDARLDVVASRSHPQYSAATRENDLAMLVVDPPADVEAIELLRPADLALSVGQPLRLVGFGLTSPDGADPLLRREGTTRIRSLDDRSFEFGADPSQTCLGDSGGPALIEHGSGELLAGVTSSGDPACAAFGRDVRVDAYVEELVDPFVGATSDGAAGAGDRCWHAANCREGACVAAADDPRIRYCAPSCGDGCPAAMVCGDAGLCKHPLPTPGAAGSICAEDAACEDDLCACSARVGCRCASRCFPEDDDPCAAGSSCEPDRAHPGRSACFPAADGSREGGCAVSLSECAGSSARWNAAALLAALATLGRRGRRDPQRSSRITR